MSTNPVYLAMGSNLGDRESALRRALEELIHRGIGMRRVSSLYDTDPVGFLAQGSFLNLVAEAGWAGSPEELLRHCLETERSLGRVRRFKDGPRRIDIDILMMGDLLRSTPELSIPHPRLHLRRFVLVPLAEISPEAIHPLLHLPIRDLLRQCEDRSGVRRFSGPPRVEPHNPPGYNPAASRGKDA